MFSSDIIGYIGGFFTTICLIPQLVTIIQTRNVTNISLEMYIVLLIGQLFWISFGIITNEFSVIIANIISAAINITILTLGYYLKFKF